MRSVDIALEVQNNHLSIVCATCQNYWNAKSRGEDFCGYSSCASPFFAKDFPDYYGPISDFSRFCWVCGDSSAQFIKIKLSERIFGLCEEHFPWIKTNTEQKIKNHILILENGEFKVCEERVTLLQHMMSNIEE